MLGYILLSKLCKYLLKVHSRDIFPSQPNDNRILKKFYYLLFSMIWGNSSMYLKVKESNKNIKKIKAGFFLT